VNVTCTRSALWVGTVLYPSSNLILFTPNAERLESGGPCWLLKLTGERGLKEYKWKGSFLGRGVTKRCRLSLLTNSALVIRVQTRREGGVAGSQPMSTAVHIMWHGTQINFGDLSPYLTCVPCCIRCWYKRFLFCFGWSSRPSTKYFFLTVHFFNLFAPSPSKLGRQSCWVTCLLVCVSVLTQHVRHCPPPIRPTWTELSTCLPSTFLLCAGIFE
jgi:hypothetical protein